MTLSDHSRLSTLHDTLLTKLPELNNLRHERGELHIRPREVQTDLDQQRSLLTKNLLDKDLIQKSLLAEKDNLRAAERSARDDKAALDTLKSITEEQWTDDKSAMKSRILELQETVERSKAQLAKHAQVLKPIFEPHYFHFPVEKQDAWIEQALEGEVAENLLVHGKAGSDHQEASRSASKSWWENG